MVATAERKAAGTVARQWFTHPDGRLAELTAEERGGGYRVRLGGGALEPTLWACDSAKEALTRWRACCAALRDSGFEPGL